MQLASSTPFLLFFQVDLGTGSTRDGTFANKLHDGEMPGREGVAIKRDYERRRRTPRTQIGPRLAARRRLRVPLRETLGAAVEEKEKEIRRREGILEDGN